MEYAWEDFKVYMGGKFVTGLRGCKYKTSQEKEPIYAAGNKPVGMGRGNKKYEASITVLQSELEAIILSSGRYNKHCSLRYRSKSRNQT